MFTSFLTAGLLGDNYVEIVPMYSNEFLTKGSEIQETQSAIILEKLIGQLMFKIAGGSNDSTTKTSGDKQ